MAFNPYLGSSVAIYLFGDGSDGDVTWTSASSESLDTDKQYNNLTITGGTHSTNGYKIRVNGTLTMSAGTIEDDGNNGSGSGAGTGTVSGAARGAALVPSSANNPGWLGRISGPGGNGGAVNSSNDSTTNGEKPVSWTTDSGLGDGGSGGDGQNAVSNNQGGASVASLTAKSAFTRKFAAFFGRIIEAQDSWTTGGGSGGSGGGGAFHNGTSTARSSGGGGGSGGGLVWIAARNLNITGGSITAKGGSGGNGTNANLDGGPGGGGGGGHVIVITQNDMGSFSESSRIDVSGGLAGANSSSGAASAGGVGASRFFQVEGPGE